MPVRTTSVAGPVASIRSAASREVSMTRIGLSLLVPMTAVLSFAALEGEAKAASCPSNSEIVNVNIKRVGVPKKIGDWWYGLKLKKNGSKIGEPLDPIVIILD